MRIDVAEKIDVGNPESGDVLRQDIERLRTSCRSKYRHDGIYDADTAAIISLLDTETRALNAAKFISEILRANGTLLDIKEKYGVGTLIDIVHLEQAILCGGTIMAYPDVSGVESLVQGLPSADKWLTHIGRKEPGC